MIQEKLDRGELDLIEILRHPIFFGEFIRELEPDRTEENQWEYTDYQREILCDFSPYVNLTCARAIGKTLTLEDKIQWLSVNKFGEESVLALFPNRVHLQPVFLKLSRRYRFHPFLKWWANNNSINSSNFTLNLNNGFFLDCRIAGQSNTEAPVAGMHVRHAFVDECIPATERVICNGIERRVCELRIGDNIESWDGNKVVTDRIKSITKIKRNQRVLDIRFLNGKLEVGENHRIYTDRGYIQAKDLTLEDNIYFYDQNKYPLPQESNIFNQNSFDKLTLTYDEKQVLLGSLLGNASLSFTKFRAAYHNGRSLEYRSYIDWLINSLNRLLLTGSKILRNGLDGSYNYVFNTVGHSEILDIGNLLYKNNKKHVTLEYLELMTELGLSTWFKESGTKDGSLITTQYSQEENKIISKYLKEHWGINNKVINDKKNNLFYIKIKDIKEFKAIVWPYTIFIEPIEDVIVDIVQEYPNEMLEKFSISSIEEINRPDLSYLYSIEVEINHNFFVNGILTKNSAFIPFGTFQGLGPCLNSWIPGYQLFVAGTPDGRREKSVNFYCDQIDSSYSRHRVTAYDNPRFTKDEEENAIARYGGKDSEGFIHSILGQHGSPVYSMFDRNFMKLENYEVYTHKVKGKEFSDNSQFIYSYISSLPQLPAYYDSIIFGIDLGYTEPSVCTVLYRLKDKFYFHSRLTWSQVDYPVQERLIDMLDTKYKPVVIGIDAGAGGSGKSVIQHLTTDDQYLTKNYKHKVFPVEFGGKTSIGFDDNGEEIFIKTKQFGMQKLQSIVNNKDLIFSQQDDDMISELERTRYTRTEAGNIQYSVESFSGKENRGEDHNTAALVCALLAWHSKFEVSTYLPDVKILKKFTWW